MGLYKANGNVLLAEWNGENWVKYNDYTRAIPESDMWFPPPTSTSVVQLSTYFTSHDFTAGNGRSNIGKWIEAAATAAGR